MDDSELKKKKNHVWGAGKAVDKNAEFELSELFVHRGQSAVRRGVCSVSGQPGLWL